MENVVIRNAKVADASGIATVHVKTWQCAYRGQIPDSYLNGLSIEKRTETWKVQLENPKEGTHTFVAENNKTIIGWCTAGKSRDEDASGKTGEVYGIYIAPNFIGKGIGAKLMSRALETLRKDGFENATLWVLTTNDNSKKFYEKKGWQVEGKTKIEKRDDIELHDIRYKIDLNNMEEYL